MIESANMSEIDKKYTMKISRLTIDKLGFQMYDKVSAVLAELIANAYDADAEKVTIKLPFGQPLARKIGGQIRDQGYEIVIVDDGSGMTAEEVNDFYLNVGINRRAKRGDKTPRLGRRVMGRKGIGKLAPFGICQEVEVISAGGRLSEKGYSVSNLILNLEKMREENTDQHGNELPYHPALGPQDGGFALSTGTTLILRHFGYDQRRRRVPSGEEMDRQLSARFGLSQEKWQVRLEDSFGCHEPIELGTLNVDLHPDAIIEVSDRPVQVDDRWLPVSGWVAFANKPYKDEVMAGVRLYSRGKIVAQTRDFDIPTGFTGENKLRSYLTGAITVEWLDDDEDLIQTDRQDIIWNSEQGDALRDWGQKLLRELARKAERSKREHTWSLFLEQSRFRERLKAAHPQNRDKPLRDAVWKAAKVLVEDADRDSLEDPDYIRQIIRLAYAIGPHHALLTLLDEISSTTHGAPDAILDLFDRARLVEIYSLGQVAHERVEAIEQLKGLVSNPLTIERELQKLIETAPWLLYPDWTPLSYNQPLDSVRISLESWFQANCGKEIVTSAIDRPNKQPDFVMLNHEGRLEIIEIKRPQHALTDEEFERAFGYLVSVKKFICETDDVRAHFPTARLTIICDELKLGPLTANPIRTDPDVFHKNWQHILSTTSRRHVEFLKVVGELQGELPELPEESE